MSRHIKLNNVIKSNGNDSFLKELSRAFQSGRINFILGAGASLPGIQAAGDIESVVQKLFESDDSDSAYVMLFNFLNDIQAKNNVLRKLNSWEVVSPDFDLSGGTDEENVYQSLRQYVNFLWALEQILIKSKTTLLPRQVNIFSTNYDLFIEKSSELFDTLRVNDGFDRSPNLLNKFPFSPKNFFNSLFNNGNSFGYKVEIPTLNLIKIHGSLSWRRGDGEIVFDGTEIKGDAKNSGAGTEKEYVDKHTLVLPRREKFKETTLDRTYYDLLRVYSNELDAENTLFFAFGFSFRDEHVYDITRRALKNPTLRFMIFAYDQSSALELMDKFIGNDNVQVISLIDGYLNFSVFNEILEQITAVEA
jgi:SIR2-like domain